jgi:RNA polymerase sigma-70 factor (ECF subfamily)
MHTTRLSLLMRIRDLRNSAAWAEFDGIYRPLLFRYAKALQLADDEAEDVVQQCMLQIHRHIGEFDYDPQRGRFKAWLRTMVHNIVISRVRKRRETCAGEAAFETMPSRECSPDEVFNRVWHEEHLRHALASIRERQDPITFEAFQRYAIDEQPAEKVCAEMGLEPERLYKIKWRLTQQLRARMCDLVGEEE